MKTAKVFWFGGNQAVRLPKEFGFDADEVTIRKESDKVVLTPVMKKGWEWLDELVALGPADDQFIADVLDRPNAEDVPDFDIFE